MGKRSQWISQCTNCSHDTLFCYVDLLIRQYYLWANPFTDEKEKYYLIAMGVGTIINGVLSVVLGKFIFPTVPRLAWLLVTSLTDLAIIVFLIAVS